MRLPEIRTVPPADLETPVELSGLRDLAYNLWWTWSPGAHILFHEIDPDGWRHYRNPVEMLLNVNPPRWERLLIDRRFMSSYRGLVDELDRYLKGVESSWFRKAHADYQGGPVAYFSTEYGWNEALGIYSGGLGVLSGDTCKSASDLGIPFVGLGLMYRRGYFRQTIDADGHQQHYYPHYDLTRLPVLPVVGNDGRVLQVRIDLPRRPVWLRVWKAAVGRVGVLLLDSDVEDNDPADRPITSFLYVRGREMRLCQEIVLGVGGVRVLRELGIAPSVWHLNEGHSAFMSLERVRGRIERDKIGFTEALRRTSGNAVFTTHTPVPAGNETFDDGLIRQYFSDCARACGVAIEEVLTLGQDRADRPQEFNLTALAIRTSSRTNAVSELHGKVAGAMWGHLRHPVSGEPPRIDFVTNGVHVPTWLGPDMGNVLGHHLGADFLSNLLDPGFADAVRAIPDRQVWEAHQSQKSRLVGFARERVVEQYARHGRSPEELRQVCDLLDPAALTLGFARRFATYKRASLVFRDVGRLKSILRHESRPVQILFGGKAHPADREGQELIRSIVRVSHSPELLGHIVFLENYDLRMARFLVQGVDVWVNTPRRPHEASGTSGMKVAVNGGLNFSVLDGWWCEGYDPSHGWVIGEPKDYSDPAVQDHEDFESLVRVLRDEIVPCYYERDESGLPSSWIHRMKAALAALAPRFSTARMVREYADRLYVPASRREGWGTEIDEVQCWSP